jgi:hypothetical protein
MLRLPDERVQVQVDTLAIPLEHYMIAMDLGDPRAVGQQRSSCVRLRIGSIRTDACRTLILVAAGRRRDQV